jgi:hypothetical protein
MLEYSINNLKVTLMQGDVSYPALKDEASSVWSRFHAHLLIWGSGGLRLPHPTELITLWAMFIHAFKSLSYSIPHSGHLKILPLTWATCPHLWHVLDVFLVSSFVKYLTSIPSRRALYSTMVCSFLNGRLWNLLFNLLDFLKLLLIPFKSSITIIGFGNCAA